MGADRVKGDREKGEEGREKGESGGRKEKRGGRKENGTPVHPTFISRNEIESGHACPHQVNTAFLLNENKYVGNITSCQNANVLHVY